MTGFSKPLYAEILNLFLLVCTPGENFRPRPFRCEISELVGAVEADASLPAEGVTWGSALPGESEVAICLRGPTSS